MIKSLQKPCNITLRADLALSGGAYLRRRHSLTKGYGRYIVENLACHEKSLVLESRAVSPVGWVQFPPQVLRTIFCFLGFTYLFGAWIDTMRTACRTRLAVFNPNRFPMC